MEHLLIDLKNLNFQQTKKSEHADKHEPPIRDKENCLKPQPLAVRDCILKAMTNEQSSATNLDMIDNSEEHSLNSSSSSTSLEADSFDASEEESEVDAFDTKKIKKHNTRGGVRKMPQRSVKTDPLHVRLRTSMKPPKTNPKTTEKLRSAQIKKLYTNKKITNFRPTSLETIFEEPQPLRGAGGGDTEHFRLVGAKKLRRALICSDGINTNKAVVNRRRARIKSKFGRRVTWKKIPLQNFLNYMQSSNINSENEDDGTTDSVKDKLETKKTCSTTLKTVNESDDFEMDMSGGKTA